MFGRGLGAPVAHRSNLELWEPVSGWLNANLFRQAKPSRISSPPVGGWKPSAARRDSPNFLADVVERREPPDPAMLVTRRSSPEKVWDRRGIGDRLPELNSFPDSGAGVARAFFRRRRDECLERSDSPLEWELNWTNGNRWRLLRSRREPKTQRGRAERTTGGAQVVASQINVIWDALAGAANSAG